MVKLNLYSQVNTEPDLRKEFNNFLDGNFSEIAKKQKALLRRMRRDSNGNLIECDCVDEVTKEPDKDTFCISCNAEGYLWDEIFIDIYRKVVRSDVGNSTREHPIAPTLMNTPVVVFYMRSSVVVTEEDKVVELLLNSEGELIKPYKRRKIYRIGSLLDFRSDNGRIEFWQIDTYAEKVKFLSLAGLYNLRNTVLV